MQFSMIFEAQLTDPTPERERQVLLDSVDQAVYGEEMGFDRVWAVEHHGLERYAHMTASEIFLTWVAAKTSTIRIGHGVVCMPFNYNHPVRVAERVGMLDALSGGRLDVGGGRGSTRMEMGMYGVSAADTYPQMIESLGFLANAWRKDEVDWHTETLDVGPAKILPRPVQTPHPPLYMACSKRDTVKLAAELGVGALVMGFAGPEEVKEMYDLYHATVRTRTPERLVSTDTNDKFVALCPTIVLDDPAKALKIGARGQRFFAEAIAHWYGNAPAPREDTEDDDNIAALAKDKEDLVARLNEANIPARPQDTGAFNAEHAYGTADQAIEYVQRLADIGVDEVMCLIQMGTVPQEACMETIKQWGEKVIPHFRNGASA
ncbi:LLM class flavin-dependent oxidoreductase [Actinomadura sp. 9N407]|uniref:LLM class flavin-dependent oxidoreductase n=1 Tax=Actinomadura sp. 9N407 TaxID=3375154 RepID=UPI0037ADC779